MTKDPREAILCVLEKIKYQASITPETNQKEIGLRGTLRYLEYPFGRPIIGKIIMLTRRDATDCGISFGYELTNILGKLKEENKIITDFRFVDDEIGGWNSYYEIALPKDFKETKKSELKISDKWLVFYTKDDIELKFNKENGDTKLGEIDGNLAPETQEYKVFLCLLETSSHIIQYKDLLKLIYPSQTFEKPLKEYQVEMWTLQSVITNIKKMLGILPKKKAPNKDIFRTLKQRKAYSLSLKD